MGDPLCSAYVAAPWFFSAAVFCAGALCTLIVIGLLAGWASFRRHVTEFHEW